MPLLDAAGMGWPNGPVNDDILNLPSSRLLMLASEARWHHDRAALAGKRVLWRAVPRNGYRPAEVDYNASTFSQEALRHIGDAKHSIDGFVAWNELDLNYERGDDADDFADLYSRYGALGRFQSRVIERLRSQLPGGTPLHYGAWTPDHGALDYLNIWQEAALACDVVDFHAYRSLAQIQDQYSRYRAAFPQKPLALTEWHCYGDLEEERKVMAWLCQVADADPLFAAAYFFIWRWDDPAEWWQSSYDVEHDQHRRALFLDPKSAVAVPVVVDYRAMARDAARAAGIDEPRFERQIAQESGFNPLAHNAGSDASGIAQIVPKWHPGVDPWDPKEALTYAANLMRRHLDANGGDWALALSSYNAGPTATSDGLAGRLEGWPYLETVRYVARILEISDDQAIRRLSPTGQRDIEYVPDLPDSVVLQQNDWTCSVRSTYAAVTALAMKGLGPERTYDEIYDLLVPTYVDANVGLKLGSGYGLDEALRSLGYASGFRSPVTLAEVQQKAGTRPVMIGGHGWGMAGHWAFVRGVEADGTLILENPAGTYQGISDRLRDSWDRLGPWSMVWIEHPSEPKPPTPPDPVPDATIDEMRRRVDELTVRNADLSNRLQQLGAEVAALTGERDSALATRNSLIEGLAYVGDDLMDDITAAVERVRAVRTERVGVRPQ